MKGKKGKNSNANPLLYCNGKLRNLSSDEKCLAATSKQKKRFWSCVEKTESCWIYQKTTRWGYGRFSVNLGSIHAHRAAKLWQRKRAAQGLLARHKCRNRACVRPSHVEWGSPRQNILDKNRDGTIRPWAHCGERHPDSTIKDADAIAIFKEYSAGGISGRLIGMKYGVSPETVSAIVHGKNWAEVVGAVIARDRPPSMKGYVRGSSSPRAKLTEETAKIARQMVTDGKTTAFVAAKFGVGRATIYALCVGKTWAHV